MYVLMDDGFSGFVEKCLAAGEWQHKVEVVHEEISKAEREQNDAEQNGDVAQKPYLWPRKTKPTSLKHLNIHLSDK